MAHAKRSVKLPPISAAGDDADRDVAIAGLIAGINQLVSQSQKAGLGTAARILCTAKEDLVHWAVDMNFHESLHERFINNQLFGPLGNVAGLTSTMDTSANCKTPSPTRHQKS